MHTVHRLPLIALASAAAFTAAPAFAGSNHGGVGGVPGQDYFPPNAAPGQCFSRRVTGPGGAYRSDRIECDSAYSQGGYGHDQWGGGRVEVETRPSYGYGDQGGYQQGCDPCSAQGGGYVGGYRYETPCDPCASYGGYAGGGYQGGYAPGGGYAYGGGYASDRYGERRYSQSQYAYDSNSYGDGYAYGRGGQGVSYPPPYGYGYVAAGRDEAGYLIWPGKAP